MTAQITPSAGSSRDGAPLVPNLSQNTTHPISADQYADRLMDDLFEDLENSLDEGVDIPLVTEELVPVEQEEEPLSLTPVQVSAAVLPPQVLPAGPRIERLEREQAIADAVRAEERDRSENKKFDRFVIGATLLALLGSMGLWAWNQRTKAEVIAAQTAAEKNTTQAATSGDSEFVGYMQRSLSAIDSRAESDKAAQSGPEALPSPVAAVPLNLPQPQGNTPQNVGQDLPFASNLVEAIERLSRILETLPVDAEGRFAPSFQVIPGTEQQTVASQSESKANDEKAAADGAKAQDAKADEAAADGEKAEDSEPKEEAPVVQHTLVGLLELGDQSVALFSIDGVTRRVAIGEAIGGSGWVLAEVAAQEAKVRKDGDVQSLFIGQKLTLKEQDKE